MAYINSQLINDIKSKNRIEDVIRSYGVDLDSRYKALCPFHHEKTPSFSVSVDKQIFTCFGKCDFTGDVITFVEKKEGVNRLEALKILAQRSGIIVSSKSNVDNKFKEYYEINQTVNKFYKNNILSSSGKDALKYLNERSLTKELINKFDIGLSTSKQMSDLLINKYDKDKLLDLGLIREYNDSFYDTFQNRIIFPIIDEDNNIVGFSGRKYLKSDLDDDSISKYSNSKESVIFKKNAIFYNINNALSEIRKTKEIIITEGFMDTIRISSIGYNNVVAIMGTAFSKEHLLKVKKYRCKVVLNLDQDNAGVTNTIKTGEFLLKNDIDVSVIVFDKYKDSDEFILKEGKDAFDIAYNNKISFVDFKLKYLKSNNNMNSALEISKYLNDAIKLVELINDDILRELKIKELSKEFDIDESVIRNKINNNTIKSEVNEEVKTKKRYNKYDISEIRILYLMLHYDDAILYFENTLGYLIHDNMSKLAYSIIEFRNENGYFEYFDFLNSILEDNDLNETINEINSYHNNSEYDEIELESCINTIKEYNVKSQIELLKKQMNDTLDINQKIEIAKKIENINKEVLKW